MNEKDILYRLERVEKALEVMSERLTDMKRLGFPHISKLAEELKKELDS